MWGLCVTKGKAQPKSTRDGKSEQSHLLYDELYQSVYESQEQYTAARAEHLGKNNAQLLDSAYRFGRTVEQFLNDFPELLGPAHTLDNQYGGVVLPAINLLWQLVSTKQRYEERILQQLDGLLEQFRYLQRFGVIYRGRGDRQTDDEGKDLRELLKPVFEGIAKFLNSSAKYYQRFRRAAVSPLGPDLHDVRNLVQKAQEELSFLLSKDARETRITTIRIIEQCAELNAENVKIKKQLQAQDERSITDRLSHLRRLLRLPHVNEQQRKTKYEAVLHWAFEFNKRKVPKYQDVLKVVERDPSFLTWKISDTSAVLVMSGNSSGIQSIATMNLIDTLQASDCPVAFFNAQLGTTLPAWQARSPDKEALHSIISQIASWDPSRLQKIDHEQQIVHKDWDCDDLERKTKFLQALLDLYSAARPVYLVFDNVNMDNEVSTTLSKRSRPILIRRMLELVRDVRGVVKILLVGLKEDFKEVELEILRETIDSLDHEQLICRLAWDSATLRHNRF
ncbi:MAG: hypothetical protein Q9226_008705 [Calogaya cf. arnoldii]